MLDHGWHSRQRSIIWPRHSRASHDPPLASFLGHAGLDLPFALSLAVLLATTLRCWPRHLQ
jgi:hypothetical protein